MLADLLPLMTDTVRQQHGTGFDLFGNVQGIVATNHRARVIYSPGGTVGQVSRETAPDAAATVWLVDHPHPIATGDTFELPEGQTLKVTRLERRKLPDGVLTKVFLT